MTTCKECVFSRLRDIANPDSPGKPPRCYGYKKRAAVFVLYGVFGEHEDREVVVLGCYSTEDKAKFAEAAFKEQLEDAKKLTTEERWYPGESGDPTAGEDSGETKEEQKYWRWAHLHHRAREFVCCGILAQEIDAPPKDTELSDARTLFEEAEEW